MPNAGKEVLYWSLQFVTSERYKQGLSGSKVGCTAASIALGSSCSLGNIYTDGSLVPRHLKNFSGPGYEAIQTATS